MGCGGQPARDRSCSARIGTAKVFATSFSVGQLLRLGQVRAMRVRRAVIGDVAGGAVEGGKGILGDLLVGHATRAREAFRLERRAGAGVDQDKTARVRTNVMMNVERVGLAGQSQIVEVFRRPLDPRPQPQTRENRSSLFWSHYPHSVVGRLTPRRPATGR